MKLKWIRQFSVMVGVVILLTAFMALIMVAPKSEVVYAQDDCTLTTLTGTYIFQARGVITDTGELRPYAEAGTWTLDGNGNAEGVASISIDGTALARREVFSATYAHDSGCVFSAEDAFGLEFDLYTTPSGTTITYSSPGFSGTMFRQ
jgi:hypothetical protein